MPAPGASGVQTSLVGTVQSIMASARNAFRRKPGPTPGAPIQSPGGNPPDLTQFSDTFEPSGGLFAPGYPLPPVEPERLRALDYPVGYNYIYTPRSYEPIGFAELRALAQNHDITRLCIETRKDQIEALQWSIKPRDERNPKAGAEKRADALTEFWRCPDGNNDFATWVRIFLEDVLVLDAGTLEVRKNRGGDIIGLDIIDGSTIKVLIDTTGRRPAPPAPAFEQIIHGRPWVLTEDGRVNTNAKGREVFADQLIYVPRNPRPHKLYGYSAIEQILLTINIGIRRQIMQLQHFTEGNVPPGMIAGAKDWSPDQTAKFQEWFDSILSGNTGNRTKVIWGPAEAKYIPFKEAPYKDDFDEWLTRIVCYAFSLPPSWAVRQVNRATAGTAQEVAIEEGLAPIMGFVKRMIDNVIQRRMGHADLEFSWHDERPIDPADQAKIYDIYIKNGTYVQDEVRDKLGDDPLPNGVGAQPMIVTASGPVLLKNLEALGELSLTPPQPTLTPSSGAAAGKGAPGAKGAPKKGAPKARGKKSPSGAKGKANGKTAASLGGRDQGYPTPGTPRGAEAVRLAVARLAARPSGAGSPGARTTD
jgi:HK97 family phage portal protein